MSTREKRKYVAACVERQRAGGSRRADRGGVWKFGAVALRFGG